MKALMICVVLLASGTVINAEENVIERYLKYLLKYLEPCAAEQNLSTDQLHNIQMAPKDGDADKLACLRACVMKHMNSMVDNKIQIGPLNEMIETVHAGNDAEIEKVKKIATDCIPEAEAEGEECKIGMKYADCYIAKLMGAN